MLHFVADIFETAVHVQPFNVCVLGVDRSMHMCDDSVSGRKKIYHDVKFFEFEPKIKSFRAQ